MAVYGSTFSETGAGPETTPTSIYGITKLASEQILQRMRSYGHKINVVRLFNVYGPGQDLSNLKQGMVSIFCAMAIKDQRIVVKGSPDRTRDLIHVDDVVTKLVSCLDSDYHSPVDIGTGLEISVAELVELIKLKCDYLFKLRVTEYYEEGFSEDIFRSRSSSSVKTTIQLSSGITNFLRWTHQELLKND
jgi:UDP-glucose 4-epimerase